MNVKGPDYHVELEEHEEQRRFRDRVIVFAIRVVLIGVLVALAFFSCLGSLLK